MGNYIIAIPSKGRAGNIKTLDSLGGISSSAVIYVEPHEWEQYNKTYPDNLVIDIGVSGMGIAYVRNFILHQHKEHIVWMLDDDITSFYERVGTKMVKCAASEALKSLYNYMDDNTAIVSLDYQQFAWGAGNKTHHLNSFNDVCPLIDTNKIGSIQYRDEVNLKEDRDFSMQVIKSGMQTKRITTHAFAAPKNGSNDGGLKEIYQSGREVESVNKMVDIWGADVCKKIVKDDGRVDVKINWKNIKQHSLF